jgi:adenosylmethionine-8-amino-7-oxononanoate aminotransferase
VIEPIQHQVNPTAFIYHLYPENDTAKEFMENLSGMVPSGLNRVFLASGGSKTAESCIKLARKFVISRVDFFVIK